MQGPTETDAEIANLLRELLRSLSAEQCAAIAQLGANLRLDDAQMAAAARLLEVARPTTP